MKKYLRCPALRPISDEEGAKNKNPQIDFNWLNGSICKGNKWYCCRPLAVIFNFDIFIYLLTFIIGNFHISTIKNVIFLHFLQNEFDLDRLFQYVWSGINSF